MSFSEFSHVRLTSIAAVVPAEEIRIEDEIAYYNNDIRQVERVKKMVGLDRRRVAPEGITASDLCIQAAERILAEGEVDRSTIDAVICVTQSGDYPIPATALVQHGALGLSTDCAAFDINLGCSGYVYGLWLAACMIESGARRRVLLLVGDAGACYNNPANRIITPVFGDGGTASLVEYANDAAPLSFSVGSDGRGYESLIRPGGGARIPHRPDEMNDGYLDTIRDKGGNPWMVGCPPGNTWMDGMEVFDFTMSVVPSHIRAHLAHKNLEPRQLDWLILHQANGQIVQNLAAASGFTPKQVPWDTLKAYGNQACASLPSALCDQLKEPCDAGKRLYLMLCGYGIGLSWASCIGDFTGLRCHGIHDFVPLPSIPTRQERIAYWNKKFAGEE
ncbi:3-oxoacyl-ACP synthase [Betaproteobacteria bacterium]|nr:3-oxoacyl-ACP synthase [Betaproteobacteria bacterium]